MLRTRKRLRKRHVTIPFQFRSIITWPRSTSKKSSTWPLVTIPFQFRSIITYAEKHLYLSWMGRRSQSLFNSGLLLLTGPWREIRREAFVSQSLFNSGLLLLNEVILTEKIDDSHNPFSIQVYYYDRGFFDGIQFPKMS